MRKAFGIGLVIVIVIASFVIVPLFTKLVSPPVDYELEQLEKLEDIHESLEELLDHVETINSNVSDISRRR